MRAPYLPNEIAGNFAPNFPALVKEVKRHTFFDTYVEAAATSPMTGDINFFQAPVGSAVAVTRWVTNFHGQGGQLPTGQFFVIHRIGFEVTVDLINSVTTFTILNDAVLCQRDAVRLGVLEVISGGSKTEIDNVPLSEFGAGSGHTLAGYGSGVAAAALPAGAGSGTLNNGVPVEQGMYDLESMPLVMSPGANWQFIAHYDAVGVVIPANTILRLRLKLGGYLYRPV